MQLTVIVILILSFSQVFAQEISGHITDVSSQSPIHYAYVACPETGEGTITDEDGNFHLILRNADKSKRLSASFVGYKTATVPFDKSTTHYVFKLVPDTTRLPEV